MDRARVEPANTKDISQPGKVAASASWYGNFGTGDFVKLRVSSVVGMSIGYSKKRPKALVVLLAAAGLSSGWIDLAELHLLVVFRNALSSNHGASVIYVLGLLANEVTALSKHTNETEALATAGETADKRSCALVLSAADLYAYGVLHTRNIAY